LPPTRINDGKCALSRMVNAFGQADFGLTTFAQTITGCDPMSPSCAPYVIDGAMPEYAGKCAVSSTCSGSDSDAHGATVRVGLPVGPSTVADIKEWTDDNCGNGKELVPGGATPVNGSLRDTATYLRANSGALLPLTRPVSVILITDGGESCDGSPDVNYAKDAALELYLNGLADGSGRHVKVFPVGFGGVTTSERLALDAIAKMGQCGSTTGSCAEKTSSLVASNEAALWSVLSAIINSSGQP